MAQPQEVDFQRVSIVEGLNMPLEFEIAQDGRVFIVSKCGEIYGWHIDEAPVTTPRTTLPNVRCVFEDGLLSIALDPNFTENNWVYMQYMINGEITRVARYTVNADYSLDLSSYTLIIEWFSRENTGHAGGSMLFDNDGNLLISTGDNNSATGDFSSPGEITSGNTNDLRGKILRIRPLPQGGYSIPGGNLFSGDALHRPEIYAMGFRNPFRMNIDSQTGYIYVGDIGPDASADSDEGPMGEDELNEITQAANFGWPWLVGFNRPFPGFDPNNLINNHPENTGAVNIPSPQTPIWSIRHQATMAGPVYRYDPNIDNEFRLPTYYDGHLIFWDFNSSKLFSFPVGTGQVPAVESEIPLRTSGVQGIIDVEFDPRNQNMYTLQWGSGCCDHAPFNNGSLFRFEYIGNRDGGVNLALGATATASSDVNGNVAAGAIDGDAESRWESASSDPQFITVDLQQAYVIDSIVLTWEFAHSSHYIIEGSVSGSTWDLLKEETNGAGSVELHRIDSEIAYRFIRITGLARGTGYGHSLYEIEIYGDDGGDEPEPLTEHAYLNMPRQLDADFTDVPTLLSQTGAFDNVANLIPAAHTIPYEPNAKLWSDRALKSRWLSLPDDTTIGFSEQGQWDFPEGTVAIKHFELPLNEANPNVTRRLETRLLVMQGNGRVYGVTYRWRADNSDAELLTDSFQDDISITAADGSTWTQTWTYPSPTDCIDCHNAESNQYLGLNTRQINSDYVYPGNTTQNQLAHFNQLGRFFPAFNNANIVSFDRMVDIHDTSASLEQRVKSYLDANCAHCHGTGNGGSQWDASYSTPLAEMGMVDELTTGIRDYFEYYGITDAKVISTTHPEESILYIRDRTTNPDERMPPIGRALEDTTYIAVLEQWLNTLSSNPQPPTDSALIPCSATATSQEADGLGPQYACDNNPGTRWSSEFSDPQSITLDLGSVHTLDRIELLWESAYASSYTIEVSQDNSSWQTYFSTNSGDGDLDIVNSASSYTARYIRITGTVRASVWGYSLLDVNVYGWQGNPPPTVTPTPTPTITPTPTPDLTTPVACTAVASSLQADDLPASNVCDGDDVSRWSSDFSDPQWVYVDLGEEFSIARVELIWEDAHASQYQIQVSNDAVNWQSVYTQNNSAGGTEVIDLPNVQGRYVRMYGTARATGWGYSIHTMNVYGVTDGGPTDPIPQISISSPGQNQQFTAGSNVTLQVNVSDSNWFAEGGSYRYRIDGGAQVGVNSSNPVSLGSFPIGAHTVAVQLYDSVNGPVGNPATNGFTVTDSGPTSPVPAPAVMPVIGVQTSSVVGGRVGEMAVDGDRVSRWESEHSDPQYLQLDFGEEKFFTGVEMEWEAAYASAYSIDISSDANNWTSVFSTTEGNGEIDVISLNGQQGRYLRVYGTARGTGYGYSIEEISVEGIAADPSYAQIAIASPVNGSEIPETQNVNLQVNISDASWFANGGLYQYQLDNQAVQTATNTNAVNLGQLSTGLHSLSVSLVNSNGQAVGVPRVSRFSVTCGDDCPNVLVFSKTSGFRHGSIEAGVAMVQKYADIYGYGVTATEDSAVFTTANLAQYSTIVFMNTTGDIFTDAQKSAFRTYMENGGGYVGMHSAADTEHGWDWYTNTLLAGAEFEHHGDGIPTATVVVEQPNDPVMNHISQPWVIGDEWYFFQNNPRDLGTVQVLANLDRSSYASNYPVEDHPVVFKNTVGQGRVFYTAIGHVDANFSEENVVEMIRKAIDWTSGD